jgi:cytochrome c-type biogenesis protein CcmH/NrfG
VLREIEQGRAPAAAAPRRPWWRRLAVPVATLAVGVGLGLAVSNFAGQRLPGQTLTGGMPLDEVSTLLAQGRSLLNSDTAGALAAYQRVLDIEPDNPEARTYTGWLVVLNGRQAQNDSQVRQGIELLTTAATLDPLYADPHCLLAVANGRFLAEPDAEAARAEGQKCLDANPPRDMLPMIQQLLDSLPG